MQKRLVVFLFLVSTILLVSCTPTGEEISLPTDTPPSVVETRVATSVPPTPTMTTTATPAPTLTPTIAFLSDSEEEAITAQLLKDNGKCEVPCIFGVEPGKTTFDDVRRTLMPIYGEGLILEDENGDLSTCGFSFRTENKLGGSFVISFTNDIVESIRFDLDSSNPSEISMEEWSAFTLTGVLSQYGVPSHVEFFIITNTRLGSSEYVSIWYKVYYDEFNTEALYAGPRVKAAEMYHLCLSEHIPDMRLYINETQEMEVSGILLEELTSLTNEDFYEMFVEDNGACIDLMVDVEKE